MALPVGSYYLSCVRSGVCLLVGIAKLSCVLEALGYSYYSDLATALLTS
jgi:hypothetical protein